VGRGCGWAVCAEADRRRRRARPVDPALPHVPFGQWRGSTVGSIVRGLTSPSDCGTTLATIDRALDEGRWDEAARLLAESPQLPAAATVALARRILATPRLDDPALRADVGQRLAVALVQLDRLDEALDAQERALVDAQEAADPWRVVVAEATAGLTARRIGAVEDAKTLLGNAACHASALGPPAVGYVLGMRAQGYLEEWEPEAAAALLREGIGLADGQVPPDLTAWARALLAQAEALAGRPQRAAAELQELLASAAVASEPDLLAVCLEVGAAVGVVASPDAAARIVRTADEIRFETGRARRPHEVHLVAAVPRAAGDGAPLTLDGAALAAGELAASVLASAG
jgi:tetratricopeptide (TPR) repeat protein